MTFRVGALILEQQQQQPEQPQQEQKQHEQHEQEQEQQKQQQKQERRRRQQQQQQDENVAMRRLTWLGMRRRVNGWRSCAGHADSASMYVA